mmetsp:Transcript_47275/g.122190  ORF Transcript_47275/g.122190 Transcript_47275/m.122190 type:complete len:122 (+) Transcript_47275:1572-1937(+)
MQGGNTCSPLPPIHLCGWPSSLHRATPPSPSHLVSLCTYLRSLFGVSSAFAFVQSAEKTRRSGRSTDCNQIGRFEHELNRESREEGSACDFWYLRFACLESGSFKSSVIFVVEIGVSEKSS